MGSTPLFAQSKLTQYSDVQSGAWYESAAAKLISIGALESTEPLLRPNDMATRAEMVKLLVRVNDEQLLNPSRQSFQDVPKLSWPYPYFETAAKLSWVRGDMNCYGSNPCYAGPYRNLNRAEAAAMLVRAFSLAATGDAPTFADNTNRSQWYYQNIQIAADHCILQGDDLTNLVRPASNMNRAEMVVMFDRAYRNQRFGTDCSATESAANISNANAIGARTVRVIFSTDMDQNVADETSRYTVATLGGTRLSVMDVTNINSRSVDLTLADDMGSSVVYRVTATNVRTRSGINFSSNETFTAQSFVPMMNSATPLSSTKVRLVFNADLESSTANDAFRYTVRQSGTNSVIGVQSATIVDARTVDLALSSGLRSGVQYLIAANGVSTTNSQDFSDDITFVFNEGTAELNSVTSFSTNGLRLSFSADLDRTYAENLSFYRVMSNSRDILVTNARSVDSRTIDLTISETLLNQRRYNATVNSMRTSGGVTFSDSGSLIYVTGNTTFQSSLIGAREVPIVVTAMTGSGTFTLTSAGLQYDIRVSNVSGSTLTAAHFHRGAAGVNGPVIQSITVTGTRFTGTWTNLTEQDRNDLLNGSIYVNLHTQANPNGEIRGQVTVQ